MKLKGITEFNIHDRNVTVGLIRGNGIEKIHPLVDIWKTAEAFATGSGKDARVVSPEVADHMLMNTKSMTWSSTFPVDGIIGYGQGGRKLKSEIIFEPDGAGNGRIVMPVPGEHQGRKNVALVACGISSGYFRVEGRDVIIEVPPSMIIAVGRFPHEDSWYHVHPAVLVPEGDAVAGPECMTVKDASLRYLVVRNGDYVGPLARHTYRDGQGGRQEIVADFSITGRNGLDIVVEMPG